MQWVGCLRLPAAPELPRNDFVDSVAPCPEDGSLVVGTQLLSEDSELKHVLAGISGQ